MTTSHSWGKSLLQFLCSSALPTWPQEGWSVRRVFWLLCWPRLYPRLRCWLWSWARRPNGQLRWLVSVLLTLLHSSLRCSSIAVNQVVNQEIDMALADITINLNRVNLVDFTIPTATEGMAIYMKTPDSQAWETLFQGYLWLYFLQDLNLFSFLSPLSTRVWISTLVALIVGNYWSID